MFYFSQYALPTLNQYKMLVLSIKNWFNCFRPYDYVKISKISPINGIKNVLFSINLNKIFILLWLNIFMTIFIILYFILMFAGFIMKHRKWFHKHGLLQHQPHWHWRLTEDQLCKMLISLNINTKSMFVSIFNTFLVYNLQFIIYLQIR